jgi:hypothetical protein
MYKKLICLVCFVLVLEMVIASGANAADPNLVGWWKLDEGSGDTAIDSSGNGFDIPLQDNTWGNGVFGGAVHFPGEGQGQLGGFNYSNNAITVCAWVWHEVFRSGQVERYVTAEPEIAVIRKEADGRLHFYINTGGTLRHLWVGDVLTEGQWYHVAGTWDGLTQCLYIDGVEIASQTPGGVLNGTSGVRLSNAPEPLNGMLDDVRIYNRALTEQEINGVMLGTEYPYASSPSPTDGALYADTWVSMGWRAGDFAVSHDVYFGDNFDDVNNGTPGAPGFRGNQARDMTYFIAGFFGYPYPDGLVTGTTYYWRIDEVNDADPNSPWKGKVWSFTIPPKKAYEPVPSDGSRFVESENPTLEWTPGFGAMLHTVYFGDDYNTIANAAGGVSQGLTNFSPGPLESEKTYYWRIDEFEAGSIHTGDVWSFTTAKVGGGLRAEYYHWSGDFPPLEPFQVFVTTEIVPEINWNWGDPGSPHALVNVDDFACRFTGEVEAEFTETYTFCVMTDDGQRLWVDGQPIIDMWVQQGMVEHRGTIDLVAGQRYSIELWMYEHGGGAGCELRWLSPSTPKQIVPQAALSPPVRATGPSPVNGATGTKMTLILKWGAGVSAASHEVYFGTDANAVTNADKSSPEYKGTKALGDENYDPGKLAWFTQYFWRIDEVNAVNPDSPWVGNLWTFTTGDFIVVDNFEDYDVNKPIWEFWLDGLGFGAPGAPDFNPGNGTGAAVGDDTNPSYMEESIVHSGNKSIPYWYDNNKQGFARYSEAELTLTAPRDWTEEGVKELSLWFYGDPNNSDELLYVAVSNNAGVPAVVVHDDPAAATIDTWTEWVIPLQAFSDQGIVLTNVTSIAIGLGSKGNTTIPGGSGKMFFDDIRLYRSAP